MEPREPEAAPVAFARVLRGLGVDVAVSNVIAFAEALAAVGADDQTRVYWAGRATLTSAPEHVPLYDAAFAAFFLGAGPHPRPQPPAPRPTTEDDDAGPDDDHAAGIRFSAHEVLRHKDFAAYTADDFAEARRVIGALRLTTATRRSRRRRPAAHGAPDLARTIRQSLRTQGVPLRLARQARAAKPRRLVLLLDVSGSMEPYAAALVRFLHSAVAAGTGAGRRPVEAFAFGTRVTRLTRDLQSRDPDAAMAAAARRVLDWSGGTRLGASLKQFNDEWGGRGAVVVILSDGWDRGDPSETAEQMARLGRVAHRVVWVNPRKASPGYQPLARGMAAALPYVDDFVEGHSIASLEALAEVVA